MLRKAVKHRRKPKVLVDGLKKLFLLEYALSEFLLEREEPSHTSIISLMTGNHHFMLGPPGTAKSQLPLAIAMAFKEFWEDPEFYFYKLMTRTMEPDELFGPLSLAGIDEGDYRREIEGFLPKARIFGGDEIYKSGDAVLNNLLGVLNEKLFKNGKNTLKVPLISMFSASNELYEGSSLDALHKRIAFRHLVKYIEEPDNFFKLLDHAAEGVAEPATSDIRLTGDELLEVQQYLYEVPFGQQAKVTMWDLRVGLDDAQMRGAMDDRLAYWLVSISRAEALSRCVSDQLNKQIKEALPEDPEELEEVDMPATVRAVVADAEVDVSDVTIEPQDFAITRHCFWTLPRDITKVRTVVLQIASPVADEAMKYVDDAQKEFKQAEEVMRNPKISEAEQQQAALDANTQVSEIVEKLEARIKETEGASQRYFQQALNKASVTHRKILEDFLGVNI